jgi:hypothetical protein
LEEAPCVRIHRPRLVAVPHDPRVRAFADALACAVAKSVLDDLRRDAMLAAEGTHQP